MLTTLKGVDQSVTLPPIDSLGKSIQTKNHDLEGDTVRSDPVASARDPEELGKIGEE